MTLKLKIFQCFLYAKIFLLGKYFWHGWGVTTHNYQVAEWSLLSLSPWWRNRLNPINFHQLLIASRFSFNFNQIQRADIFDRFRNIFLPWDSCSSPPSCGGRSLPECRTCWAGCRTRRCWFPSHWCTYSRDHGCSLNNRLAANCKPEYLRVSIQPQYNTMMWADFYWSAL